MAGERDDEGVDLDLSEEAQAPEQQKVLEHGQNAVPWDLKVRLTDWDPMEECLMCRLARGEPDGGGGPDALK